MDIFNKLYLYVAVVSALLMSFTPFRGQSAPASRDPEGLRLIQKAEVALLDGQQINDGILKGKLTQRSSIMGSTIVSDADVKLSFLEGTYSRVDAQYQSFLSLSRSEICALDSHGESTSVNAPLPTADKDDEARANAPGHGLYTNCWSVPVWFFPAMLFKATAENPHNAVVYHASKDGNHNELVRFYRAPSGSDLYLTVREVQLDHRTLLPFSVKFWRGVQRQSAPSPSTDPLSSANGPIEIHYSDYRKIDKVLVPFQIEWSQPDGAFTISITIDTVRLNVGLSPKDFDVSGK